MYNVAWPLIFVASLGCWTSGISRTYPGFGRENLFPKIIFLNAQSPEFRQLVNYE